MLDISLHSTLSQHWKWKEQQKKEEDEMENLNIIINIKFNCLTESNVSKTGSKDELSEAFYTEQMLLFSKHIHSLLIHTKLMLMQ